MLLDIPVRLGVQLQPQHASYAELRNAVRRLEDLGDGHDTSGIVISNELKNRDEDDADDLFARGTRLFTLGFGAPEFDYDLVTRWLAWRDARNA